MDSDLVGPTGNRDSSDQRGCVHATFQYFEMRLSRLAGWVNDASALGVPGLPQHAGAANRQ